MNVKRDYYLPPTDYPRFRQIEREELRTQLETKRDRMAELEAIDCDWTAQQEDEYRALEVDVQDLDKSLDLSFFGA